VLVDELLRSTRLALLRVPYLSRHRSPDWLINQIVTSRRKSGNCCCGFEFARAVGLPAV